MYVLCIQTYFLEPSERLVTKAEISDMIIQDPKAVKEAFSNLIR